MGGSFPQCGNISSIVWKKRENFFHSVEQPSAEPESRSGGTKGEREVYSEAPCASNERAKRTEWQNFEVRTKRDEREEAISEGGGDAGGAVVGAGGVAAVGGGGGEGAA